MNKLNYYFKKYPKIKRVFNYAKNKYNKVNLPQHNWQHVMRDLYRALVIAEKERGVDYLILITATILHDIGVTEGSHKKHEFVGSNIVKRDLPKYHFSEEEINKIVHCIKSHGKAVKPITVEAKIINDADKLEKSGYASIFCFYRFQMEECIPIGKWIDEGIKRVESNMKHDFYTQTAKEICNNGFAERLEHFNQVKKSLKKRIDFLVTEENLL